MDEGKVTSDMHDAVREETLGKLRAGLKRLTEGRRAVEAGESIAALRALTQARENNARAISTILSACLHDALEVTEPTNVKERGRSMQNLIHLTGFALSELCVSCRQKIASRLRRG